MVATPPRATASLVQPRRFKYGFSTKPSEEAFVYLSDRPALDNQNVDMHMNILVGRLMPDSNSKCLHNTRAPQKLYASCDPPREESSGVGVGVRIRK